MTSRAKTWIVVSIMLAMMLTALDMTIVGTAMPSIVSDLHGVSIYSWVFSAYLLTSTTPIPIYGKLADMLGRKRVFMVGTGLFTIGSALAGVSQSMPELILFRALQGLGAAGVLPVALTIVGDIFTLEQRGRVQGLFSGVWALSAVIGPLTGAAIVEHVSWRWVFYINVPLGILVMLILWLAFHEQVESHGHAIDYPGTVILTAGVTLVLLGLLDTGTTREILLGIALVTLVGFVFWEQHFSEPVLPLSIFRHRMILLGNIMNFFGGIIMFGLISYMPLFVQGVQGQSPTVSGQAITPMMIGWPLAALSIGPLIKKVGYRVLGILGGTLVMLGTAWLGLVGDRTTLVLVGSMLAIGAGLGFSLTSLLIGVQNAVPWNLRGVVTGSTQFFRNIGGAIGVAILAAVFNEGLSRAISRAPRLHGLNSASVTETLLVPRLRDRLVPALHQLLLSTLNHGLAAVFLTIFGIGVLAFVTMLALPAKPRAWDQESETAPTEEVG